MLEIRHMPWDDRDKRTGTFDRDELIFEVALDLGDAAKIIQGV